MHGDVPAAGPPCTDVLPVVLGGLGQVDGVPLQDLRRFVVGGEPLVEPHDLQHLEDDAPSAHGAQRSTAAFGPVGHTHQHAGGARVQQLDLPQVEHYFASAFFQPCVQ